MSIAASDIEEFAWGHTRQYLYEGKIVVLRGSGNMTRESVDTFTGVMIECIDKWSGGDKMCFLIDVSHRNQGFSTYTQQRIEVVLSHLPPTGQHYAAVVMTNYAFSKLLNLFLMRRRGKDKNLTVRVFYRSEEAALAWLREMMKS